LERVNSASTSITEPTEANIVQMFPVRAPDIQSLASAFFGGTKETGLVMVTPSGMSLDLSSSRANPETPVFHERLHTNAVDNTGAGQIVILRTRKEPVQGLKTEFVAVQMPPKLPMRSATLTEIEALLPEV